MPHFQVVRISSRCGRDQVRFVVHRKRARNPPRTQLTMHGRKISVPACRRSPFGPPDGRPGAAGRSAVGPAGRAGPARIDRLVCGRRFRSGAGAEFHCRARPRVDQCRRCGLGDSDNPPAAEADFNDIERMCEVFKRFASGRENRAANITVWNITC